MKILNNIEMILESIENKPTGKNTKILEDLFPFIDSFNIAIESIEKEKTRLGLQIIYEKLIEIFAKHQIFPITAKGYPFNPAFHKAIDIKKPTKNKIM